MTWPIALIIIAAIIAIAWLTVALIAMRSFRRSVRDMERDFDRRPMPLWKSSTTTWKRDDQ